MAGLADRQNILTRVIRHQTVHINCPDSRAVDDSHIMLYDTDVGSYIRDDTRTHILVGSLGAEGETEDSADPDAFDRNLSPGAVGTFVSTRSADSLLGIPNSLAGSPTCGTSATTGFRFMTARISMGFILLLAHERQPI